jgi:uncharacterized NAD(P)/FAD-binding protein YdhS
MYDVAIVGGGFAGAMTAVYLLGQVQGPLKLALIERRPLLGRGIAYSTDQPFHLLNVRAAEMSAYADDPLHFVQWCGNVEDNDFVPRGRYGEYIGAQVAGAIARAGPTRQCARLQTDAIGLLPLNGAFTLKLATGETLHAKQVVLAIGQAPPAPLRVAANIEGPLEVDIDRPALYISDPWSAAALAPLPPGAEVLLVGTGLTAVDLALALLSAGARKVTLVSRRAKLPAPQILAPAYRDWLDVEDAPIRITELMSLFRQEAAKAAADWRSVVDATRSHLPALLARLPLVERRRFLRHGRTPWEAHRNRLPPPTAASFEARLASGHVRVVPARLSSLTPAGQQLAALLTLANGKSEAMCFDRVINCTGPDLFYRRGAQAIVQAVIGTGLARLEPLGLGLDVTSDFRLLDEDGVPTRGLYALGAPTKGRFWEVQAVAELRVQAHMLAQGIAASLASPDVPPR